MVRPTSRTPAPVWKATRREPPAANTRCISPITLDYSIAPGSGTGELVGIGGSLELDTANGHAWELSFHLPE